MPAVRLPGRGLAVRLSFDAPSVQFDFGWVLARAFEGVGLAVV
jgi:hypothetical protein